MAKRIAITALAVSAAAYVAFAQAAPRKAAPPAKAAAARPAPKPASPKLSVGRIPRDGLVSLWSGEGNANDSAGENHGKAAGGVGFAAGRVGQAFKLDGKDDHINCGNPKSLQITGSQTIAMWIKPDRLRLGVRQNPIAKAYGGEGTMTLEPTGELTYFYGASGKNSGSGRYVAFTTFGRGGDSSTGAFKVYLARKTAIKVGQWTHVALVRDLEAKRLRWYVNGDLVTEVAAPIPAAKASNLSLLIGKGYVSNFAGLIDEVAIWNRTLRAQEVRLVYGQLSPLARGLVGMWAGDGSAADSLGGHNGQLTAGASYAPNRHGDGNGAFSFDGKKGFVMIPDSRALDTDESFTLSAWVKPRVWRVPNLDEPLIVAKWNGVQDPKTGDYYLCLRVDGRARFGVSPGKKEFAQHDTVISKSVAPKNKWTHLAVTFDRGKMKLYVNGKLNASKVSATIKHTDRKEYPHDDVIIGAEWNNQHNFDGAIDDVAIWGRALSPREVRGVFEAHGLRDTLAIAAAPYVAREEAADRVVLDDGKVLKGTIENAAYEVKTFFGKIKVPAGRVAGLAPAGRRHAWVLLADGQVILGALTDPVVHLKLMIGGKLNIPLSGTRQCGYRITKARPASAATSEPAVALCSGQRLIWTGIKEQLRLRTPYGEVNLPIGSIFQIGPDIRGSGYEVQLANGSRLSGTLLPEELTLKLKLGPQAKISRERIYALTRPAEAATPIDAAFVAMRNGDRLIGGFKDETLTIRTKFGQAKLPLSRVLRMTLTADQAGKVTVEALIWDQSQVTGLLTDREIALAIRPDGPTLKLPATQVAAMVQPTVMPPPEIARKIEDLIVRLGAESYVDREAAEKALIKMGKGIVPMLRKHLKNRDPEIGQRVRQILEKLQPPSKEKGGDVIILPPGKRGGGIFTLPSEIGI